MYLGDEMMMRRRRTLKFETRNITVLRPATGPIDLWCPACSATTAMVTPERAAQILKTNPRAIYQHVERGEMHFRETGAGELLICCASLTGKTKTLTSAGAS